ncbi:MAG: NUDIX hydrolase [Actinomycetia bacterium]|nr:NUDIX hydrolase [Actinomycetes bacterium]
MDASRDRRCGVTNGGYDPHTFPPFAVTADIVLLTIDVSLSVLLVKRGADPFAGSLALPGGFVLPDESVADTARRELMEETGIAESDLDGVHLEQLATFSEPDRDPRMRVVSTAYLALSPTKPQPTAGTDAAAAHWVSVDDALAGQLAFDHAEILAVGVERARAKLEYTTLATNLAGPEFTLGELQHVYEVTWGCGLERANFRRKVLATQGFVAKTQDRRVGEAGGAPAVVYRAGGGELLVPPMMRPRK